MKSLGVGSKARRIIGIAGAVLAFTLVLANMHYIYGLLSTVLTVNTSGVISSASIRAYWESGCVNNVSSINWGTLSPGSEKSVTIYIKNTGSVVLTLSFTAANWNPQNASTYLTLRTNYSGTQINPNAVLGVTLTLSASASTQGISSFSFDINIIGTEVA